jgi:peptidoglycan/LPS O-acetylase OafA/YrhL
MIYWMYAAAIFVWLCFMKRKSSDNQTSVFSKNDTLCLKGIAALLVVLHHLGQYVVKDDKIHFNGYMGGVSVGIFFMLSAYGLYKAGEKKGYYKRIFMVKIPALYLYQVLMNIIYYLLFFTQEYKRIGEVLPRIFNVDFLCGMSRLNGFSWFISTILITYAVFGTLLFVWEKWGKNCKNKRFWFACSGTVWAVLWYVLVSVTPIEALYSRSIFCFAVGAWVAVFEKEIVQFLQSRKRFLLIFIGAAALMTVCFFLFAEQVACVAVCVFIVVLFAQFHCRSTSVYAFLGKISLEIYLVQKIFFLFFPFRQFWREGGLILLCTLLTAVVFNWIVGRIKRLQQSC